MTVEETRKELKKEWDKMPHPKISWETFKRKNKGKIRMGNEVTEEEQMTRFEENLKENDWGHQPA
jgi:hypothetical protein